MENEKRLISVDEWDTFFAEHIYNRCFRNEYEQGYTDALDRVDDWMDEHPTVDAVEVVHCCDCKKCVAFQRSADSEVMLTCTYHTFRLVDPTDYCVWGERKDNG